MTRDPASFQVPLSNRDKDSGRQDSQQLASVYGKNARSLLDA